ncbi:hypothetical protein FRC00_001665 [Tulasnella sp. 408]|nr:hypothetical protein FRC00_001665 [Tulasnella sp. 408]
MVIPFLSPTLKEVDVEVLAVSSSETCRLLHTLNEMLPHDVVSLRLAVSRNMGDQLETEIMDVVNIRSNLRVLRIPGCPMNAAMFIPNLRVLEAESDSAWNSNPGAILFQLSDKCPLIEDLRIIFPSDSILAVESIRPLFRCPQLRSLDLEYPGAVDMRDEYIREMGRAWRDLEALHISSRRAHVSRAERPSGIPIASLVTFAQAFSPKLRKLAIHINTSDVPFPPDPPIRFTNLEFFSVGTSQLGYSEAEYRRVVWFLHSVLPLRINAIHSDLSTYDGSWSIFKYKPHEDGRWSTSAAWDTLSEMFYDYRKVCSDREYA